MIGSTSIWVLSISIFWNRSISMSLTNDDIIYVCRTRIYYSRSLSLLLLWYLRWIKRWHWRRLLTREGILIWSSKSISHIACSWWSRSKDIILRWLLIKAIILWWSSKIHLIHLINWKLWLSKITLATRLNKRTLSLLRRPKIILSLWSRSKVALSLWSSRAWIIEIVLRCILTWWWEVILNLLIHWWRWLLLLSSWIKSRHFELINLLFKLLGRIKIFVFNCLSFVSLKSCKLFTNWIKSIYRIFNRFGQIKIFFSNSLLFFCVKFSNL